MNKKILLKGVIEVYQNDFQMYEGEDGEELDSVILNLIVELSRYVNDIRYCSKIECPCSPESSIRRIMKDNSNKLEKVFHKYNLTEVNMNTAFQELKNI